MNKIFDYVFLVGALLLAGGALFYLAYPLNAPYLFSAGALLVIVARLKMPYTGTDFRQKRLSNMQHLASILYIPTAYFMFTQQPYWFLCFLIAAMLEIVVAFRR